MVNEYTMRMIKLAYMSGYTSGYLRESKDTIELFEDFARKALRGFNAVESAKQRALLVAFAEWHSSTYYEEITMEEDVDEFLNTLKHNTK
jgi:hypothetical protein